METEVRDQTLDEIEVHVSVAKESELRPDIQLHIYNKDGRVLATIRPEETTTIRLYKKDPIFRFGIPYNAHTFRFNVLHDTAVMLWDGRRWSCKHAEPVQGVGSNIPQNTNRPNATTKQQETSPLILIGAVGMIVGVIWLFVAFQMNVFVCGGLWEGYSTCSDSHLVLNLNLSQRRNLHFAGAALLTICSVITTLFGTIQTNKKSM